MKTVARASAIGFAAVAGSIALVLAAGAAGVFPERERSELVEFWNQPGRYRVELPDNYSTTGPWQVRLTVEGSRWFWLYQRAVGAARIPPTQDATAVSPDTEEWEKWVEAKVAYDWWLAGRDADAANAAFRSPEAELNASGEAPPHPGMIPADLLASVGNPPRFASAVTPLKYVVTFEDGEEYSYIDNVRMRQRFAYYRFSNGTVALGRTLRQMTEEELDALFEASGMTASEQRISRAVSRLEGGFETINTYDTGFVSVGFIQFVFLEDGRHSLTEVLQLYRAEHPKEYHRDFRRYGIDVNSEGEVVVVDPATGAELAGNAAVLRVVDDKRLTAVFQRAGRRSVHFRAAQVKVAKSRYWPADDVVTVAANGREFRVKVSDIIRSEAGIATLFDRKVNRGNINPFPEVVGRVMEKYNLTDPKQAAAYEREIVAELTYREDFLKEPSLGQPD